MLANGVLERASGPYASPMHIVQKDGGKDIRIVGDYRALNMSIVKDTYQIPRILEFQNKMKDAKIFSTLDLKSGFHQIPLAPADKEKLPCAHLGVVFNTLVAALVCPTVLKACGA